MTKTRRSNSPVSLEIKQLCVRLLNLGVEREIIAVATGYSAQSVTNWKSDIEKPKEKRLPGRPRKGPVLEDAA